MTEMFEALQLRDHALAASLVIVRLGVTTLTDELCDACEVRRVGLLGPRGAGR
jgi:hypothetical protein